MNLNKNFNPIYIHPEEEPNINEINKNFTSINDDLNNIDSTLTLAAKKYKSLLDSTKLKLNNIKNLINIEKERQEDINILCNKYSDFSSVLCLSSNDFEGNLTFSDNILSSKILKTLNVDYKIEDISGNGQHGNGYVYQNDEFISKILDTSNQNYINDNNLATAYEYSRITMNNTTEEVPLSFNKDSIEAECSIIIKSSKEINKIIINSDRNDLILKEIYTSKDGSIFSLDSEYDLLINKNQEKYNNQKYIYGSGIISIKPSLYIKMCFKSSGYTDETIACIKTFNSNNNTTKKIEKILTAKRHVIKINNIGLYKDSYQEGFIVSKELITTPIKYIGLYCNEYINSNYDISKNITYHLIINGIEYNITPINSDRNGKKIIRTSSQSYQLDNTIYIQESIKSAKLKITINSSNENITPFISNIKVLIGGYKC